MWELSPEGPLRCAGGRLGVVCTAAAAADPAAPRLDPTLIEEEGTSQACRYILPILLFLTGFPFRDETRHRCTQGAGTFITQQTCLHCLGIHRCVSVCVCVCVCVGGWVVCGGVVGWGCVCVGGCVCVCVCV